MYIIGVDLSLSATGVCLLNTETKEVVFDEILTTPKQQFKDRCRALYEGLCEFYGDYEHLTPLISVELPKGSQSSKAAMASGACTGVFFSSPMATLPKCEYGPQSIKKLVGHTGVTGTERKRLNIDLAEKLYPEAPFNRNKSSGRILFKDNHCCDALLLCHLAYLDYKS